MNERITEGIVRDFFSKHICSDLPVKIYEQQTDIPRIQKLLKSASKSGSGQGYPEFIVTFSAPYDDFLIVVECKSSTRDHESKNRDQYNSYAVDGVLLYSSFLSKDFDVLAVAVSGQDIKKVNVSTFLQLKGSQTAKELKTKELVSFESYINLYLTDETKERQSFDGLLKYSKELNEYLRDIDLAESHRPLLVSGILIALDDPAFESSYKKEKRPSDLAESLVKTITKILDQANIQGVKRANMEHSYGFIKTHSKLADDTKKNNQYNTLLKDLIKDIKEKVKDFTKTYKYYDVLGKFYNEFLRYANGDTNLGIVLTPHHVTDLFIELANVNEKSIVLDNCCGTGGFLISAMKKMIECCNGDKDEESKVYKERLIGVESYSNMFSLACSNMMLRGDGKSNIYYGSCFDYVTIIKKHKPTVGLLNPPYAKKKEDQKELNFVLNNLECLERGASCVAILPISCAIDDPLKGTLLEKHTLEAVMSMPEELFYDSDVNTVTCIMVFTAHIPHEQSNKKTWFGYWRNDGFTKVKNMGRVDKENVWPQIKNKWIESYRNREVIEGFSLMKKVSANDEWCAEAYMEPDYSSINEEEFKEVVLDYILFCAKNM